MMRRLRGVRFSFKVVGFVAILSMLLGSAPASSSPADPFFAGGVER